MKLSDNMYKDATCLSQTQTVKRNNHDYEINGYKLKNKNSERGCVKPLVQRISERNI